MKFDPEANIKGFDFKLSQTPILFYIVSFGKVDYALVGAAAERKVSVAK